MKIAWFTPFAQTSAIGKVGAEICEELSKANQVEIWTAHRENLIETSVPVRVFDENLDVSALPSFDTVVYNLGNFAGFHREIYDVSQRFPGIVILHDQTMAGFWGQYHCIPEFGGDDHAGLEQYRQMVGAYYGTTAAKAVDLALASGQYPFYAHESMEGYSFLEPSIQGAKGVFTHAAFFAARLRDIANVPTSFGYLPCKAPRRDYVKLDYLEDILSKARGEHQKILVSTGIVHPVKQIDKVVQILLEDCSLSDNICYLVIGNCDSPYGERLKALAQNELRGCLYMLGYQPDDVMWAALQAADLAVNLRYPNSEVCSLSLLEQMAAGKAVMTLDGGIYGEVPNDTVLRIARSSIASDGRKILHALTKNELDPKIGERAAAFVNEQCTAAAYCNRLLRFIDELDEKQALCKLQDRIIQQTGHAMRQIRLGENATPASYATVINRLSAVLGEKDKAEGTRILGIWMGFPYAIPNLRREGISRLIGYMGSSLLRYHPDVRIEVWCYSFNLSEAKEIFSSVSAEDFNRIVFVTEQNWAEVFRTTERVRREVGSIDAAADTLVRAAREVSQADVFIPIILYLDRITEAEKKLFVPGYDMAVAEHYDEFVAKDDNYIARNLDYIWRAQNFVNHGAHFFCNSDTIRRTEILKYVPGLREDHTHVVYLPPNIPEYKYDGLLDEQAVRERFRIKGRYLFYPTQIRPYKNVTTLILAFSRLIKDNPDLQLVLTGWPQDVPEVDRAMKEQNVLPQTILLHDVSEQELYSLYRYAAGVPVPSVMEGGFPYQAMEGLWAGCPVAIADIPVSRERILSLGFSADNCGLSLFAPMDDAALAEELKGFLADRDSAVQKQRVFAEKFFAYTWKEASDQYYNLFFKEEMRL